MNIIEKWIHRYRWTHFSKSLLAEIIHRFVREGYAVENPGLRGIDAPRLDLKVSRDGRCSYIRFFSGGLIGVGAVCYLCKLVDTMHIDIVVVVSEPIGGLELNTFNDNNIMVVTAPTPDELVRTINKKHSLTTVEPDTTASQPVNPECGAG